MAIVILVLKALSEVLKDEFSEFGRPVQEQKLVERQSQPMTETAEKKEAVSQTAQTSPPSPAQDQTVQTLDRVTPKQTTKRDASRYAL